MNSMMDDNRLEMRRATGFRIGSHGADVRHNAPRPTEQRGAAMGDGLGRVTARVAVAVAAGGLAVGQLGGGAAPASAGLSTPAAARVVASSGDWAAYLAGSKHHSYAPGQTAITPATAPDLVRKWSAKFSTRVLASPTVADGAVYAGTGAGWFVKLSEKTGKVLHKIYIGHQAATTCGSPLGVVSTATVANDPRRHELTVYVAGPNGYLFALRASNLSVVWRAVVAIPSGKINNYFNWASPTVARGTIYMGVSSNCDKPLVRAGVISYSQRTGRKLAEFYTVPKGQIGGSVWSSIAVDANGNVYASTGNGPRSHPRLAYSESIIKLAPRTLRLRGRFQVPLAQVTGDGDFGSSPLIFGNLVGACDKNGIYYALAQSTMKVVWERRIGIPAGQGGGPCLATPAYDGKTLFVGGNGTTLDVNGVSTAYPGSVQELAPDTGDVVWAAGLAGEDIGSPSLDGGHVLAVPIFGSEPGDGVDLVATANSGSVIAGTILRQLVTGSDFGQAVFADDMIFAATVNGVAAFGLPAAG
jgi:outer membrane protein assembly factor BamB